MQCPFLKEARVKYCEASPFRRMILELASDTASERCSSPGWTECPAATRTFDDRRAERCPFLRDALTEFCSASPVTKYIPANDSLLSRCRSDGHVYCELYRERANPEVEWGDEAGGTGSGEREDEGGRAFQIVDGEGEACTSRTPPIPSASSASPTLGPFLTGIVEGVPVPPHLAYVPNHMWLDVAEDGSCHVGVDAFLTRVIGSIDEVSFVRPRSLDRPIAVLCVHGVDLTMAFPNALMSIVANAGLRSNPLRIGADPYGTGWLFEGSDPVLTNGGASLVRRGLVDGYRAANWIHLELERLDRFVRDDLARPGADGDRLMTDGGVVVDSIASELDRESLIALFNEFFAYHGAWR